MNIFEIIYLVFLIISLIPSIPYIISEYKILRKLSPIKQTTLTFEKSFLTSGICFFITLFFTIISFIIFIISCAKGSYLNDNALPYEISLISGFIIGIIIGVLYYSKIRKPYFFKYYPEKMKKYREYKINTPGIYRADYLSWIFVGFFILSFFDLGSIIGFILTYIL